MKFVFIESTSGLNFGWRLVPGGLMPFTIPNVPITVGAGWATEGDDLAPAAAPATLGFWQSDVDDNITPHTY